VSYEQAVCPILERKRGAEFIFFRDVTETSQQMNWSRRHRFPAIKPTMPLNSPMLRQRPQSARGDCSAIQRPRAASSTSSAAKPASLTTRCSATVRVQPAVQHAIGFEPAEISFLAAYQPC
jgi:hypothetical protein